MTAADFKRECKAPRGGYLFCGEEEYLMARYLGNLRQSLVEDGDLFNHIRLDNDSFSLNALRSAIETLPLMAEQKLVEVRGVSLDAMKESDIAALCEVLRTLPAYPETVLVISANREELNVGTKKEPSKRFKMLSEYLCPVVFSTETPAHLAAWIAKHFAAEEIIARPTAVDAMMERCGFDMYVLNGEIEKLTAYIKAQGRGELTVEDVALVVSTNREIGTFDFANAILNRQPDEAYAILSEMKRRRERPEIILSGVSRVICDLHMVKSFSEAGIEKTDAARRLKMNEYKYMRYAKSAAGTSGKRLSDMVGVCLRADRLIKSSPLDSYTVLDRLTAEALMR